MEQQKKPWSELTEEERQVIRESWKHELPEGYDVFCIGDFVSQENVEIPGNLYASGSIDVPELTVCGALIVGDDVYAGKVTVYNTCLVGGNFYSIDDVTIYGDFIVTKDVDTGKVIIYNGSFISDRDIATFDITIHNGDCIVSNTIDSCTISVDGTLDCYDVETNGHEIHASDYVCRSCEEEKI